MSAIVNDPNNPTGKMMTEDEHRALRQTDKGMYGADVKHHRFYDGPYMYAGKPNEAGPNYIGPNYSNFINGSDPADKPWAIVVSFSKSDAMANPGLCALVVHPSLKKDLQTVLLANNGIGYDLGLMGALPQAFGEANDKARLKHYAHLRSKYMTNRELMEKLDFPLLPGDPCMTAVVDVSDFLGRRLAADKFGMREIKTVSDLVEALGNVAGVVTVAQNERGLLRFALSARPDTFAEGAHRVRELFNNLRHAPKL